MKMLLRQQMQRVVNSKTRVVPLPQVEQKIEIVTEKKEEEIVGIEITEEKIVPTKQPKKSKKKPT
jgi:hypothetical protein